MALLNTHPDYMNFGGAPCSLEQYPVSYYIDLLEYIRTKYGGQFWHALPRDVARFWKSTRPGADGTVTLHAGDAGLRSQKYRPGKNE